jgi:hypothetical protein
MKCAIKAKRKEVLLVSQPLVDDQRHMGAPKEGGNPLNIDSRTLRVAPDQRRFGSGFKEPESQSLKGAKKTDAGEDNPSVGGQRVYASGTIGCFGFTEEEWIKMEESSKPHFPDRKENNEKDTR